MSSIGIAELTALGAAPASGDKFVVVDVSDTTQSLAGSTKYVLTSEIFTAPTFTGTTTVSVLSVGSTLGVTGAVTLTASLSVGTTANVIGNFSVATNKFTVAAASGNTVVAGTLGVTGIATFTATIAAGAAITLAGSAGSAGTNYIGSDGGGGARLNAATGHVVTIGANNADSLTISSTGAVTLASTLAVTGNVTIDPAAQLISTVVGSATAATVFQIRQGATVAATFAATTSALTTIGTITGTRLIGGTDIASAIAPGTFSDGTAPANNAYSSANVFSLLVSKTVSATTGSVVTSEVYHKQTGANSAGSTIASFSYIDSAHTSGTTLINIANVASVEATGNGGTTTTLGCYRTQALIGTGATITNLSLVDIRSPANSGTITTLVGLDIQAMTAGGTNYAIRTASGRITFGSMPTSAAGLPAGTLWNNSGVVNIV